MLLAPLIPFFKSMKRFYWLLYLSSVIIFSCTESSTVSTSQKVQDGIDCTPETSLKDLQKAQSAGMKSFAAHGGNVIRAGTEFNIIIDGFKIIPLLGLSGWFNFIPRQDSAMVVGDLIVNQSDFNQVQNEVTSLGLKITDVHQYPARDRSVILFMHIIGYGDNTTLTTISSKLFTKLQNISAKKSGEPQLTSDLNTKLLDSIIGHKGEYSENLYKYRIGRPGVLKAHGILISSFLGYNTWAAWQGTNENALVSGDFTMLKNEVGPVIKALAENGIEAVMVHNHSVFDEPGIFFLHYWGVGNAERLAKGLRAAFNQQEIK
jgi:hypothetical protein